MKVWNRICIVKDKHHHGPSLRPEAGFASGLALGAVRNRWIGGTVKEFVCASLALTWALAMPPIGLADSLGYAANTSNPAANSQEIAKTFAVNKGWLDPFLADRNSALNANPGSLNLSGDIGMPFNDLLNSEARRVGVESKSDELADVNGTGTFLLASNFGDRESIGAKSNGRFYSKDKIWSRAESALPKGNVGLAGVIATLAQTSEPGSLFMLGAGLLGLALALFWRSAKHPAAPK
jgi:hypothetical protein